MAKRCIGIDISSSYLRAVQILRTGQEFRVERAFSTPIRRSTDILPDILRSLTSRHGFDRRAEVAASLPHSAVFFRNVETDFAGLEQIRQGDPSVLKPDFPIEPDEIITQVYSYRRLSDEKYSVLTAALNTESLRQRLSVLAEAKMHLNLVEAPIFAIHSAVAANHPEIVTGTALIAYVDESYLTLAVTKDNVILIVRNIPAGMCSDNNVDSAHQQIAHVLSREAQITWQKAFGAGIGQDCRVYLAIGDNSYRHLEALIEQSINCQVTIVDPYAKLQSPADPVRDSITRNNITQEGQISNGADCAADGTLCVAEGLALRLLAPEKAGGTNFLHVHDANKKSTFDPKRELAVCTTLVAAIVVVWLVGLFLQLSFLETSYGRVKNEIREIFQSTLPDQKIVSPLVQLEQQFESFRKDYGLFASFCPTSLSAIDVLCSITKNAPAQASVKVHDLLIAADMVRVTGTCDSFESVYEWQRQLRQVPGFTLVDVQDIQKEPKSGEVRFTILLRAELKEQK